MYKEVKDTIATELHIVLTLTYIGYKKSRTQKLKISFSLHTFWWIYVCLFKILQIFEHFDAAELDLIF